MVVDELYDRIEAEVAADAAVADRESLKSSISNENLPLSHWL